MKVFISWSGDRSKAVADVLRRWFPSVLQAVRPYFSPDDVAKGSRWSTDIAKELDSSRVGLLVITPENQEAPWLLFEAGALAKNLDRSKVCPILFGAMEPTDVKGPLVQFQAAQFSKDEMRRVVKMLNTELAEAALTSDVLDSVFEMWWPKLEQEVAAELAAVDRDSGEGSRSDRDILEEVLALTRRMASDRERRLEFDHPVWDDLMMSILELARLTRAQTSDDETIKAIRRLIEPLRFIAHREMRGKGRPGSHVRHIVMALEDILDSDLKTKPSSDCRTEESIIL